MFKSLTIHITTCIKYTISNSIILAGDQSITAIKMFTVSPVFSKCNINSLCS